MYSTMTLPDVAAQVRTYQAHKKDYIAPLSAVWAHTLGGFSLGFKEGNIFPTEHAHSQIATCIDIPQRYYRRMLDNDKNLLVANVNRWLEEKKGDSRLLRLHGQTTLRALLSPSYRRLDNDAAINNLYPLAEELGCKVVSCDISDTKLYLKMTTPRLTGEVQKGDIVQGGIVISNSEVGAGSLLIQPLLYRLVCLNGMIVNSAGKAGIKRRHLGARQLSEGVDYHILSTETQQLSDRALWAQVQDTVRHTLSEVSFAQTLSTLQGAAQTPLHKPLEVVELAQTRLALSDEEKDSVLERLVASGPLTAWSLANAVTNIAHQANSYERATQLEQAGWTIASNPHSWSRN